MEDAGVKRTVLVIACISAAIIPFMGSAINIALPSIGEELKIDAIMLGWIPTSFLLAAAACLLPFGRIADIYGRKKIFFIGMIIYAIGSLFSALSFNALTLISFRVIQGIGLAMSSVSSMAIVTSVFPIKERGYAIGITVTAVYTGLSLGPFLGGLLTQHFGWQSIFYINAIVSLIVIVIVIMRLKGEWAEARGEAVDVPGSILFALALLLLMYGLSRLPSPIGFAVIAAGIIVFIGFLIFETRTKSPVIDISIFSRNPAFTFSNFAALLHYGSTFSVTFLISLYLQYIKGLSPQTAGLILVSQPIMMALFSPFAGRLSDRIEPRIIASIGMAITCLAIFMLSLIGNDTSLPYIIITLLILGIGFAFFSSPNTNAIMSSVEKRYIGIASGMVGTMRSIGQMTSMGLALMIFSIIIGKAIITPDLYPLFIKSANIAFAINAGFCLIGIFFSLSRGKVRS